MQNDDNRQALKQLLGLESDAPAGAAEKMRRKLAEPVLSDDEKLQGVWQKLEERLALRENANAGNVLVGRFPAKSRWFAAAAAAVALLTVSVLLLNRAEEQLPLTISKGQATEKVSLSKPISRHEEKVISGQLGAVTLDYRFFENFKARFTRDSVVLSLQSGDMVFQYSPDQRRKTLIIRTPHCEYTVTGTEFMLRVGDKSDHLLVLHGNVSAKLQGRAEGLNVGAAQLFSSSSGVAQGVSEKAAAQLVKKFRAPEMRTKAYEFEFEQFLQKANPENSRKIRRLYIELTNGQIFSGQVASEARETIVLLIAERRQPVKIQRAEIKIMRELH